MFAFINSLSPFHLLVIGVAALLLFGNRLPEVARSMGKAINEFKRGMRETSDEMESGDKPRDPEKLKPGQSEGTQNKSGDTNSTTPSA